MTQQQTRTPPETTNPMISLLDIEDGGIIALDDKSLVKANGGGRFLSHHFWQDLLKGMIL